MTALPFISVVVPHLNQPEHLRRCLDSLDAQTYPSDRFDIVVVDNGSSVLPDAVLADFPRARLTREAEPGPGPARNRGVAESEGELLAFIDADCLADPRWLEVVAEALHAPGAMRIIGGDVRIALAEPKRPTALEAYESLFAYQQKLYIEKKGFSGTGNLAAWREDRERIGPFAGIEVAEDRDWGRRAREAGYAVVYVPDMIVFHPARTSLKDLRRKWARQLRHDLEEWRLAGRGAPAWIARALAVAASPLRDVPRTLTSKRVPGGPAARLGAVLILLHVRWFRAVQMIRLLTQQADDRSALFWNRHDSAGPQGAARGDSGGP